MKSATEEYKAHTQAMSSLQDVANYTGESMGDLSEIMDKYENVMTKSDLTTTIKNFTLMGMKAKDTEKMIEALTNSAIRNRNANYTVSEAVRVASEGYRQGLSTLSDSAGVTENLSVMLDNYAKSIGKTSSQLTEEEQNQAYVTRTMQAAAPFAQAMAEYSETLAGKQGDLNNALQQTQVVYATAIEPTYSSMLTQITATITAIGEFISEHEELTAGATTFVITLGLLSVGILAAKKAFDAYSKSAIAATIAQEGFNAAISANPIGMIVTLIATAIASFAALESAMETNKAKQEELKKAQEEYNRVLNGTIELNNSNVLSMKETKDEIEKYIELIDERATNMAALNYFQEMLDSGYLKEEEDINAVKDAMKELNGEISVEWAELNKLSDSLKKVLGKTYEYQLSQTDAEEALSAYSKRLKEAESIEKVKQATDIESVKTQRKEAAALEISAEQMQDYLNIVKKGNTESEEYQEALSALIKKYPEAANAEEILIDKAEDFISAEKLKADQAWNASQATIDGNIEAVQTFIDLANAAQNDATQQAKLAEAIGIEYSQIIPTLTSVLNILQAIGGQQPKDVPGAGTPKVTKTSGGGSSSYSNKQLDNYKKEIEHKKALDQISLKEEISMYEYALQKYAKTADERMQLREKIYDLNKELAQKEKEMLDQQTEDYEAYIQQQKNARGSSYDVSEQTKDYNKIIQMHKNYLNQIMKDERLSLEERQKLYRETLETVRDYEQQIRDLRVESIDNTVSQLANAITKQLEKMQDKDKKMIDENLKVVEEWKKARIDAINQEYDARIEAINKELEALNKAEKQKTRDEEDTEYERKRKRLEELVAFEHDATTRANYQKELNNLMKEYQKTLDNRNLEDKKSELEEQRDLVKQEQDAIIQSIEDEADRQKETYNKQLEDLEKYYEEQISMAQDTAENMLLNVEENQNQILQLLKSYGNAYEITGQTLGEKLAQGINDGLAAKIENIIARIQNTLDAGIENQISKMASSVYRYESGTGKSEVKSITTNVVQNNYIEQNPEMPSETYRKLNNISQQLASELAGM